MSYYDDRILPVDENEFFYEDEQVGDLPQKIDKVKDLAKKLKGKIKGYGDDDDNSNIDANRMPLKDFSKELA